MIKVTVGNNVTRKTIIAGSDMTIAEAFAEAGIDWNGYTVTANGMTVQAGAMSGKISDLGLGDTVSLSAIAKRDNA